MKSPLRVRGYKSNNFLYKANSFQDSTVFFGEEQHVFSLVEQGDITSSAKKTGFSSFFGKEKEILSSKIVRVYGNAQLEAFPIYDTSNLVGKNVFFDACIKESRKESCLSILKSILLRIWEILKRFFQIKKVEKKLTPFVLESSYDRQDQESKASIRYTKKVLFMAKSEKNKQLKSRLLKKKYLSLIQPVINSCKDVLSSSTFSENKSSSLCQILKCMWIELEKLNINFYKWSSFAILTHFLKTYSKSLILNSSSFFSHIGHQIYMEWRNYKCNQEDFKAMICALSENIEMDSFSELLESHGASNGLVSIVERMEELLLPSQKRIWKMLVARQIAAAMASLARNLRLREMSQTSNEHLLLILKTTCKSLSLLNQIKEINLEAWSTLIQILANEALSE